MWWVPEQFPEPLWWCWWGRRLPLHHLLGFQMWPMWDKARGELQGHRRGGIELPSEEDWMLDEIRIFVQREEKQGKMSSSEDETVSTYFLMKIRWERKVMTVTTPVAKRLLWAVPSYKRKSKVRISKSKETQVLRRQEGECFPASFSLSPNPCSPTSLYLLLLITTPAVMTQSVIATSIYPHTFRHFLVIQEWCF